MKMGAVDMNDKPDRQKNQTLLLFIIPTVFAVLFGLWCMGVFD